MKVVRPPPPAPRGASARPSRRNAPVRGTPCADRGLGVGARARLPAEGPRRVGGWLALAVAWAVGCSASSGTPSDSAHAPASGGGPMTADSGSTPSAGDSTAIGAGRGAAASSSGDAPDAGSVTPDPNASEEASAADAGTEAATTDATAGAADGGSDAPASDGTGSDASSGATFDAGTDGRAGKPDAAVDAASLPPITVYLAGDSTVSQYVLDPNDPKSWAGWGQMLAPHYDAKVKVIDDAVGGRTARRFIQEGHLAAILDAIQPGDYLLVQFGTNDSNTTSTYVINGVTYPYYAAAATDFKTYLGPYITGARAKSAIPVLVTPPPRNSAYCNGPRSLADYGQAMIELGAADRVAVVDLGLKAHAYVATICPKPTTAAQETIFKVNPDGTIDGTHFQENGARLLAGFVAQGIAEDGLGLAAYALP